MELNPGGCCVCTNC